MTKTVISVKIIFFYEFK